MAKEYEKAFNPTITEIHHIGDELLFQREYYNSIHKKEFIFDDKKGDTNYINLCEKLGEYLIKNFEYTKSEVSSEIIENIEKNNYEKYGKPKGSHTPKNPSIHYFHMYSLFKIYNFIDDYDIINLLNYYGIISELEEKK